MEKVVKIGKQWFAGNVNSCDEPQASGPGQWDGKWFRTKKQAEKYLEKRMEINKAYLETFKDYP